MFEENDLDLVRVDNGEAVWLCRLCEDNLKEVNI